MIGSRPGELSGEEARGLAEHLAGCAACRARQADEEAVAGLLVGALLAEANARDFASFSDEVLARLPGGPARARAGAFGRLRSWARRHRVLATTTALAPTLAALGLVIYLSGGDGPQAVVVEVSAEERATMVLDTSDGPVVLFGDPGPEGS
jgi:anti-sigma factor RsiW